MKRLLISCMLLCTVAVGESQTLHSVNPVAYLPDGTEFKTWKNETGYTTTYFVDANNPIAADSNAGSEASPFKTINKAAQVVQAGERVYVKKGIYRELVRPVNSGSGSTGVILYEAEPGTIIRGSEKTVNGDWISQGNGVWMLDLSLVNFPSNYNPFLIDNLTQGQIFGTDGVTQNGRGMPWVQAASNTPAFSLPRGMVFQNLKRLEKASSLSKVEASEGLHWTDRVNQKLYVHTFDNLDPNNQLMEVTTRHSAFRPMQRRMSYVHVKGFIIEQVGNGFPLNQVGALSAFGGNHFLFENNVVREVNGIGIDIGESGFLELDVNKTEASTQNWEYNIARGNWVENVGISGISSLALNKGLIENNTVVNGSMYGDADRIWAMAGIKTHKAWDAVIRQNIIMKSNYAGLWTDLDNRNSRFTKNVIVDVNGAVARGIFNEKTNSIRPSLVDNNIIWDAKEGYYQHEGAGHLVYNNAIGNVSTAFRINGQIQPTENDSLVFKLVNNIVYQAQKWYNITGGATVLQANNAGSGNGMAFSVDSNTMEMSLTFNSDLSNYATNIWGKDFFDVVRTDTPGPIQPTASTGTHTYELNKWAKWYSDNLPPTVLFNNLTNNQSLAFGSNISVNANASDSDGYVKSVSLYLNNQLLRTAYDGNYTWGGNANLQNMSEGTYVLKLVAEDDKGALTTNEINIIIEAPAQYRITHLETGLWLKHNNNDITCQDQNNTGNFTKWELIQEGAYYRLKNVSTNLYLAGTIGDTNVVPSSVENDLSLWQLTPVGDNFYIDNKWKLDRTGKLARLKFLNNDVFLASQATDFGPKVKWGTNLVSSSSSSSSKSTSATIAKKIKTDSNRIYPNPSYGEITLQVDKGIYSEWSVFDSLGRLLLKGPVLETHTKISLSNYKGLAFIRVTGKNGELSVFKALIR